MSWFTRLDCAQIATSFATGSLSGLSRCLYAVSPGKGTHHGPSCHLHLHILRECPCYNSFETETPSSQTLPLKLNLVLVTSSV